VEFVCENRHRFALAALVPQGADLPQRVDAADHRRRARRARHPTIW
jgi:hypothetical protein